MATQMIADNGRRWSIPIYLRCATHHLSTRIWMRIWTHYIACSDKPTDVSFLYLSQRNLATTHRTGRDGRFVWCEQDPNQKARVGHAKKCDNKQCWGCSKITSLLSFILIHYCRSLFRYSILVQPGGLHHFLCRSSFRHRLLVCVSAILPQEKSHHHPRRLQVILCLFAPLWSRILCSCCFRLWYFEGTSFGSYLRQPSHWKTFLKTRLIHCSSVDTALRKVIMTVLLLTAIYVLCWSPYWVSMFAHNIFAMEKKSSELLMIWKRCLASQGRRGRRRHRASKP